MKTKIYALIIVILSFSAGILGSLVTNNYAEVFLKKGNGSKNPIIDETQIIKNLENEIIKTGNLVSPSVISIVVKKDLNLYRTDPYGFFQIKVGKVKREIGGGTGFFIDDSGTIITNKHVIQDSDAQYSVITSTGEEFDAKIIGYDKFSDIAFLKINSSNLKRLEFVKKDEVKIGQFAIAVGNALAKFQNSVTLGIVSGLDRKIDVEGDELEGLIQTDAAINPGNSGGPLVNLDGKVMGINTAIVSGTNNVGFAIPITQEEIDKALDILYK